MTGSAAAIDRQAERFGLPWEDHYGYAQAVRVGRTIYLSGQLSHDPAGRIIAPAPLDGQGRPASFANMEVQMRETYANAIRLLDRFGATLDDVVEETIYVLDVDTAFAVAGRVRRDAYGTARPHCASTLVGVTRLALAEQLVEISMTAMLGDARL